MTLLYTKEQKALIKLVHDVAEQELSLMWPKLIEQENALLNCMNLGSISAFIW